MFNISSFLDQNALSRDVRKSATELISEMEDYFSLQDTPNTSIQLVTHKNTIFIEFRTYDGMFDTINRALYEMITLYGVSYRLLEERLSKDNGYGWDFSEDLLPYMKQIIFRAVNSHDIRAPEDIPTY